MSAKSTNQERLEKLLSQEKVEKTENRLISEIENFQKHLRRLNFRLDFEYAHLDPELDITQEMVDKFKKQPIYWKYKIVQCYFVKKNIEPVAFKFFQALFEATRSAFLNAWSEVLNNPENENFKVMQEANYAEFLTQPLIIQEPFDSWIFSKIVCINEKWSFKIINQKKDDVISAKYLIVGDKDIFRNLEFLADVLDIILYGSLREKRPYEYSPDEERLWFKDIIKIKE